MALKDLLKKKDKIKDEGAAPAARAGPTLSPDIPEFQFFRTTTSTQETIEPPSFPGDPIRDTPLLSPGPRGTFGRFRSRSNASSADGAAKGLERLHFGRTRSSSSANVPENLPEVGGDGVARTEEEEAKWEKRATVLVTEGALNHAGPTSPRVEVTTPLSPGIQKGRSRSPSVSAPGDEENIQEAIRLHEKGNLEASTALFGRLADPTSHNNALAQVLYGLALRYVAPFPASLRYDQPHPKVALELYLMHH
jgi:hypothetical protein